MDKLQELLKEYQLSKGEWVRLAGPDVEVNDKEELVLEATLISKKYGFIQRLVENDKIDFSWEGKLSSELVNLFERKLDNAEGVIALLSIQDEPIEFLVSILK